MLKLFGNISNILTAPLTKYMFIAILVLGAALGGTLYLSYQFYGDKKVAEVESEQLQNVVAQEREQTLKAIESEKLLDEAIENIREGEEEIDTATERLQDQISNGTPNQPIGETENGSEKTTEGCDDFLSADDVRLLQQSYCLSDGETSDCNF